LFEFVPSQMSLRRRATEHSTEIAANNTNTTTSTAPAAAVIAINDEQPQQQQRQERPSEQHASTRSASRIKQNAIYQISSCSTTKHARNWLIAISRHCQNKLIINLIGLAVVCLLISGLTSELASAYKNNSGNGSERMVRLCIASVDPVKLTSQCVMCNRREFPLTVIDCTGITKVNDLVANPLSVQEATCLIYNCRRVSMNGRRCRVVVVFHHQDCARPNNHPQQHVRLLSSHIACLMASSLKEAR
jgi:hypothetical protein